MGQVCSGAAIGKQVSTVRDPEDKELDAIEMKETKIPDFDGFFERAAAPLNELVEIHNGIFLSEENLKSAAAAMQGEVQLRVSVGGSGRLDMCFWRFDEKDEEVVLSSIQIDELLQPNSNLHAAYDGAQIALERLNEAFGQPSNAAPSRFAIKRGRVWIEQKGAQDALIRDLNIMLFSLRKQLALVAHITSLSEAVRIFIKTLAKEEDISGLHVETDESGAIKMMNGDRELNLKKLNNLSKPAVQFRDALVDLLENVETAATSVPELVEQSNAFVAEAQGFPSKVPEAASSANLGITEMPKAATSTASNVKALGNAPHIAQSTSAMIQYAARELSQAVSIPIGA